MVYQSKDPKRMGYGREVLEADSYTEACEKYVERSSPNPKDGGICVREIEEVPTVFHFTTEYKFIAPAIRDEEVSHGPAGQGPVLPPSGP